MNDKCYFGIFIKIGVIVVLFLLFLVLVRFALADVTIFQSLKSVVVFLSGGLIIGLLMKICLLLPIEIKKGRKNGSNT